MKVRPTVMEYSAGSRHGFRAGHYKIVPTSPLRVLLYLLVTQQQLFQTLPTDSTFQSPYEMVAAKSCVPVSTQLCMVFLT